MVTIGRTIWPATNRLNLPAPHRTPECRLVGIAAVEWGVLLWGVLLAGSLPAAEPDRPVDFSRDIKPILSEHCFRCHGPDEAQRQADLRLDRELDAKRAVEGTAAIVPGKRAVSELWRRINSSNPDERMPPAEGGSALTPAQIELLGRWIDEGAPWQQHWAFAVPQLHPLPAVQRSSWPRTPVDYFVLAAAERQGLSVQPEADKERLLRRVTFDLTGLPPSLEELDAFLADDSPQAYGRVVERLLASPRFGERLASPWLDAARYADTSGYQNDGPRSMWRWRDWVIDAFNRNQPFDQFTIEQIAGDLLPGATLEQRIATGFNRNHRGNSEGGIIPEEYQVEYVADRVDTTCTVWLGLTMGCARCHDHKYDPITQREFYQVFAYFNNIPEFGRAIKEGNSPPYIAAPTREQERQLAQLERKIAEVDRRWNDLQPLLASSQREWEQSLGEDGTLDWNVTRDLAAYWSFDDLPDGLVFAAAESAEADQSSPDVPGGSALPPRDAPGELPETPGRIGRGLKLDGQHVPEAPDAGDFGYFDAFSVSLWIGPKSSRSGTVISRKTDEDEGDGWSLRLEDGFLQVHLVKRWLDDAIRVATTQRIPANEWIHVAFSYDGSRLAQGVRIYCKGSPLPIRVDLDLLNQSFAVKRPLRLGGGNGPSDRFQGSIDEVRIYRRSLTEEEVQILATSELPAEIARLPGEQRTEGQRAKLREAFLSAGAPAELRELHSRRWDLSERRRQFLASIPTVMVMEEREQRRPTYVLLRGQYDKPGEEVAPGLPACFAPRTPDDVDTRLEFAQWLVADDNPLTSRVFVNRLWQLYFGNGLVRTAEDFGAQGEPPSHPELLDWLAIEFQRSGWDIKHLVRRIVLSSTYRQAAQASAEAIARDPDNRWLARGPRLRLRAEAIRDQALAVSGLLVERLGGPSVKPYQPADLWKDLATDNRYEQDHGASLYRRSLYTYWKRTVAPPGMVTFDAASREFCQVRVQRTNTPLQALSLLNDVTYLEASRMLAERILTGKEETPRERLQVAFRLCTSRHPSSAELSILERSLARAQAEFRADPQAAQRLLEHGEHPCSSRLDRCELAAYSAVANLLLNLDEVVTQ